ncbi:MAG: TraE/TraK family type IV conjugative transfer system protein, partial [Burkholderiaceae bacterium]|nr:TraE/TraK family type IV conjugative transfer system protein [Burkholderiaceae bacterium]
MSKSNPHLDVIANAFSEVKAWKAVSVFLALLVVALLYFVVDQARNAPVALITHEMAASKGRIEVAVNGEVTGTNAEYLSLLTRADLGLILNFQPATVITQTSMFLNRLSPDLYAASNVSLLAEAQNNKDAGYSQSFYPDAEIKAFPREGRVEMSGTLVRWQGSKEILRQRVAYEVEYRSLICYFHITKIA